MKVIALNYSYDLKKLSDIGRVWANDVYVDKNFISEYSSASYATFVDKNPNLVLNLYTDNFFLLTQSILPSFLKDQKLCFLA